jgi:hypothetical protein
MASKAARTYARFSWVWSLTAVQVERSVILGAVTWKTSPIRNGRYAVVLGSWVIRCSHTTRCTSTASSVTRLVWLRSKERK